jgi:TRAP-type C4-dicarboxylate transport system permease small subunit
MDTINREGHMFSRVINRICDKAHMLGEIGTVVLLLMVFYSVVLRYFFNKPPEWVEEIGCYTLMMIIWVSIGGVLKHNHHISLDLVVSNLSAGKKIRFELATTIIGFLFCSFLAFAAIKYAYFQYKFDFRSSSLLGTPLWIPYSLIPLGTVLISLQYLVKFFDNISLLKQKKTRLEKKQ